MEIIKYLGEKLSEKIKISPPAARGLIKLAIKDELGAFKPFNEITFNDLKAVIQNALKIRVERLNVQNVENLINYLTIELTENQSLIIMSKV